MKIRVWCDSGANIHSKREVEVDLEENGISDHEWEDMTELQKEEFVKGFAFERLEWGWEDLE